MSIIRSFVDIMQFIVWFADIGRDVELVDWVGLVEGSNTRIVFWFDRVCFLIVNILFYFFFDILLTNCPPSGAKMLWVSFFKVGDL